MRALFPEPQLKPTDFRPRGLEMTRLEAFSDAVFAFAITLLVVSLEVPETFDALAQAMRGFFAFGICFTLLMWIWFQHTRFFTRYGMQDAATVALNGLLLFVVLFYVYPLKFLWSVLVTRFSGAHAEGPPPLRFDTQGVQLMVIYGLGFTAIFFTLALLYVLAYFRRKKLELNELEIFDTRWSIIENVGVGGVGVLSIAIVLLGGTGASLWAGLSYSLIGVVKGVQGWMHGSRRARLEAQFAAPPPAAASVKPAAQSGGQTAAQTAVRSSD